MQQLFRTPDSANVVLQSALSYFMQKAEDPE